MDGVSADHLREAVPSIPAEAPAALPALRARSVVLVGMMGSGKSTVGRRLAQRLHLPFLDSDTEIEKAANMTIPEIFATQGEPAFRSGERRVIARLLHGPQAVIATGGGAFMDTETRDLIRARAISVWLKADADVLMRRVRRRANRPLLQTADPEGTLRALLAEREPVYALADLAVISHDAPHDAAVTLILDALMTRTGTSIAVPGPVAPGTP